MIDAGTLSEMASIAEGFFESTVEIWKHELATPNAWDDSTDTEIDTSGEPTQVVQGWFRNQPDHQLSDALAALAHNEDGRLFVPLGTGLERRDLVRIDSGESYRVVDTNIGNTWRVLERASLMRIS